MIILYYVVLFGGFLIFVCSAIVGRLYYNSTIQEFINAHMYISLAILNGYVCLYIYCIVKIVRTKEFQKYEKMTQKNKIKVNKEKRKTIYKKAFRVWFIFEVVHLITNIYLLWRIRNGTEVNNLVKYWCVYSVITPILFAFFVYYHRHK